MASHIYLAKVSTDLVCWCNCAEALMAFPPQENCPWCGCGWLFSCIECRKGFTFAHGVSVDESWEDLARRDMTNYGVESISQEDIDRWVSVMRELLAEVKVGTKYVCLDGAIIPADAGAVQFEGWHSRHDLDFVPQVAALEDRSVLKNLLSNVRYWRANALVSENEKGNGADCRHQLTAADAYRIAEQVVELMRDNTGVELDFSVESLARVDELLVGWHEGGSTSESMPKNVYLFGCYLGEVIIRNHGGRWRQTTGTAQEEAGGFPVVLELPGGTICNPIGQVSKLLDNGPQNRLLFFCQVVTGLK